MDTLDDKIRKRAYELWQQAGQTGDPEDHWLQAERELAGRSENSGEASIHRVTPDEVVVAGEDMPQGDQEPRD